MLIVLRPGSLDKVLVESRGRPVYPFRNDPRGKCICAAAFGAAWFAVSGAGQAVSRPASKPGGGSI